MDEQQDKGKGKAQPQEPATRNERFMDELFRKTLENTPMEDINRETQRRHYVDKKGVTRLGDNKPRSVKIYSYFTII